MRKFKVEYNPGSGWHRIAVPETGIHGEWQSYQGIATLNLDDEIYIAVSDYHRGGEPSTSKFKSNVVYKLIGQVMA